MRVEGKVQAASNAWVDLTDVVADGMSQVRRVVVRLTHKGLMAAVAPGDLVGTRIVVHSRYPPILSRGGTTAFLEADGWYWTDASEVPVSSPLRGRATRGREGGVPQAPWEQRSP